MNRFVGKTILVTGGARGIGAACVERLHSEGASVVIGDLRQDDVDQLVAKLGGRDRLLGMALDVAQKDQVDAFVQAAVDRFSAVDGLINCAGILGGGNILNVEPDSWRNVLAVNLDGTFYASQAFGRAIERAPRPAAIVNLSSTAGVRGSPNIGYGAAKFAVSGMTKGMALQLAHLGIRVNAVAPGMIRTAMTEAKFADPEQAARVRADQPIGREGLPEEVAAAIAFLLSGDASFITGVILPIDGGWLAGNPIR